MAGLSARGPTSAVDAVGPALGVVHVDDITLAYDFPGGSSVVIGQHNIDVLGPIYNPDADVTSGIQGFMTPLGYRIQPQGNVSIDVFGIGPGQVGRPSVVRDQIIEVVGIDSAEAFGSLEVLPESLVIAVGIGSGGAFGEPTIHRTDYVDVSGISSGEAFGTPIVVSEGLVSPSGISSGEAVGSPTLVIDQIIRPEGIGPGEVGVPSIKKVFRNTERFYEKLSEVSGERSSGGNSMHLIELLGGAQASFSSYEPDASTFRGEYYYNTRLNVLFKKAKSRNPDSYEITYYWKRISGL